MVMTQEEFDNLAIFVAVAEELRRDLNHTYSQFRILLFDERKRQPNRHKSEW
jgi:hypothetical protein